jgi:KaiC/GvpD/RAD55 family RecA-like ATPase
MKKPIILTISGKQGSGKTTLTKNIVDHFKTGGVGSTVACVKFADIIYEMHDEIGKVAVKYGIPFAKKESVLLQLLGTEFGRNTKGPDVWVDATINKIKSLWDQEGYAFFIIDDCRFPNEADMKVDGFKQVLVRLECSEAFRKGRADAWRDNTQHPSETGLDNYPFKHVINTETYNTEATFALVMEIMREELANDDN